MIGAGNVSTHISRHLHSKGHRISCIYSRTLDSARLLATEFGAIATKQIEEVPDQADFYLICVADKAVASVAKALKGVKGICLHTAGALPLDVLSVSQSRYGVLYPLQTLSRDRKVDLSNTPFLVEGSSPEVSQSIAKLAGIISHRVYEIDSQDREVIHLAAVFTNNFTNHMVHIGQQILQENQLDLKLLEPILEETVRKIEEMGARDAQTGPALRNDQETMRRHRELLKSHPEWEKLYTFMSRDIENSGDT